MSTHCLLLALKKGSRYSDHTLPKLDSEQNAMPSSDRIRCASKTVVKAPTHSWDSVGPCRQHRAAQSHCLHPDAQAADLRASDDCSVVSDDIRSCASDAVSQDSSLSHYFPSERRLRHQKRRKSGGRRQAIQRQEFFATGSAESMSCYAGNRTAFAALSDRSTRQCQPVRAPSHPSGLFSNANCQVQPSPVRMINHASACGTQSGETATANEEVDDDHAAGCSIYANQSRCRWTPRRLTADCSDIRDQSLASRAGHDGEGDCSEIACCSEQQQSPTMPAARPPAGWQCQQCLAQYSADGVQVTPTSIRQLVQQQQQPLASSRSSTGLASYDEQQCSNFESVHQQQQQQQQQQQLVLQHERTRRRQERRKQQQQQEEQQQQQQQQQQRRPRYEHQYASDDELEDVLSSDQDQLQTVVTAEQSTNPMKAKSCRLQYERLLAQAGRPSAVPTVTTVADRRLGRLGRLKTPEICKLSSGGSGSGKTADAALCNGRRRIRSSRRQRSNYGGRQIPADGDDTGSSSFRMSSAASTAQSEQLSRRARFRPSAAARQLLQQRAW
ncbi:hypothetical protein BOX15_Mlig027747g1 [Macrostomum lignano]|uniref:Uncharacterized protein n=1 Tax=Macrostomum lignano TaxID=282301 RepID=A0A267GUH5_9PLAT|nr:hypothetical protein BOX15_Mlig027747g1 [Macrostomum lignano]